jgi:hypothetical protein
MYDLTGLCAVFNHQEFDQIKSKRKKERKTEYLRSRSHFVFLSFFLLDLI